MCTHFVVMIFYYDMVKWSTQTLNYPANINHIFWLNVIAYYATYICVI